MPGMHVTSTSGAYVATLVPRSRRGRRRSIGPEVGLNTWVVSVTDAAAGTPAGVTMIAERPWMPLHGHGATTYPVVTPGDPGTFTVSGIDFFMAGYWEHQAGSAADRRATADKATFAICVPQ